MAAIEGRLERLTRAVREDAALRRIRRLQPVGGQGDKFFPPTYPGEQKNDPPRHVFEYRRIDGKDVLCVLVDSVQSQANRLEEALQSLRDEGRVSFPVIAVDFEQSFPDIGRITTLQAPHRVFDAIIRDSMLDGKPFGKTDAGKRLIEARSTSARSLYELAPTSLIFGAWNSTGEGGGLGAKFPRAIVSEIVGVGVAVEPGEERRPSGRRTGSRIDPLGIRSGVRVYKTADGWSMDAPDPKAKPVRPSEVNHSNIAPSVTPLGVSAEYLLHTFALSFGALRRLRFKSTHGPVTDADVAGRTVLAALGIAAYVAQDRSGYCLRSRCDLVPEEGAPQHFELIRADGTVESFECSLDDACELLAAAVKAAEAAGLTWSKSNLVLQPQEKLVRLVEESRAMALEGVDEDENEG